MVRNISITTSSVTIEWTLEGAYSASRPEIFTIHYGVDRNRLSPHHTRVVASSRQTYSIELTSLEVGREYFYQIEARNMFEVLLTDLFWVRIRDDSEL